MKADKGFIFWGCNGFFACLLFIFWWCVKQNRAIRKLEIYTWKLLTTKIYLHFPPKYCDIDTIKVTGNNNPFHFINRFTSLQLCRGKPCVLPILIGMNWHHFKRIIAVQSKEIRKRLKLCKIAQVSYFIYSMWLYNFKQIPHNEIY